MAKIEVKCFAFNDFAQGAFKVGKTVDAASNFLPGEIGLAEKNRFGKYYISSFIKISSKRVKPKCDVYDKCGGCHLLHMNYEAQMNFKKDYVLQAFKDYRMNIKIDEYIVPELMTGYRNKMQVAVHFKDNKIIYGFYEEDSHKIIPLNKCLVQSDIQNDIIKGAVQIIKEMRLRPYDEDKRIGLIRHLMIREAVKTKQLLLTIVTNGEQFPGRSEFVKRIRSKFPQITSIVQNINTRKTSIILGEEEKVLFGPGYIIDILSGIKFKISSKTFYQINPYQTEKLYNKVKEYVNATGSEVILDAYCGVGTIGITLAGDAKKVIGVESNKQSVINARINASDNNIKNISFVCEDATEFIQNNTESFDVLIMDPPRSGSTKEFMSVIDKSNAKTIIYVSCEAKTLARDISMLKNYKVKKICLVDMFVGTYHVETVVLLSQ